MTFRQSVQPVMLVNGLMEWCILALDEGTLISSSPPSAGIAHWSRHSTSLLWW